MTLCVMGNFKFFDSGAGERQVSFIFAVKSKCLCLPSGCRHCAAICRFFLPQKYGRPFFPNRSIGLLLDGSNLEIGYERRRCKTRGRRKAMAIICVRIEIELMEAQNVSSVLGLLMTRHYSRFTERRLHRSKIALCLLLCRTGDLLRICGGRSTGRVGSRMERLHDP